MSDATMETMVKEILQRCVRIESRLVMVADHAGLDVRPRKVVVGRDHFTGLSATVDAMDVSLSRIVAAIKESEQWADYPPGCYEFRIVLHGTGERVGSVVIEK